MLELVNSLSTCRQSNDICSTKAATLLCNITESLVLFQNNFDKAKVAPKCWENGMWRLSLNWNMVRK